MIIVADDMNEWKHSQVLSFGHKCSNPNYCNQWRGRSRLWVTSQTTHCGPRQHMDRGCSDRWHQQIALSLSLLQCGSIHRCSHQRGSPLVVPSLLWPLKRYRLFMIQVSNHFTLVILMIFAMTQQTFDLLAQVRIYSVMWEHTNRQTDMAYVQHVLTIHTSCCCCFCF